MLGFESRGWLDEQGFGSTKVRVGIQNFAATATWFPGDPANATGGLWLKAGAGIAQARITVFEDAAAGVDSSSFEAHIDDAGPGLLAGVGYEFRIVRSLAVGLDVTANYQPIHEAAFDTNWFVPVALSMHWYF